MASRPFLTEMSGSGEVSVVMPCWNSAKYVVRTLATVAAQTRPPLELIVVDDGSTDGTVALIEQFASATQRFPVRLIRLPHCGPGAARNAGINVAVAGWIAFLDSDDLWHPTKLAIVSEWTNRYPSANLFCHDEIVVALDGSLSTNHYRCELTNEQAFPRSLYLRNCLSTSAVVCRRDLVLRHGGFDTSLSSGQDYELWLRMSSNIVPVFIEKPLGTYVLREGNISTSRYWRRLANVLRIKWRHRALVARDVFICSTAAAILRHLATPLVQALRRI